MQERDIKIDLGPMEKTLVIPLLARAKEAQKEEPVIRDNHARDIVARIGHDLSEFDSELKEMEQLILAIRAYNFDASVRSFLDGNEALVVNLGAGLDSTFQRVDDGRLLWVNVDLPDVVALREKLMPGSERERTIAKSIFDYSWMDDIARQTEGRSILLMAAGVLVYYPASKVQSLFHTLASAYPSAHFVFDSMPGPLIWVSNLDFKKKKWADLMPALEWHLEKADHLKNWVDTLQVIAEYPMFSRVPFRKEWSRTAISTMRIMDLIHGYNMVMVRF